MNALWMKWVGMVAYVSPLNAAKMIEKNIDQIPAEHLSEAFELLYDCGYTNGLMSRLMYEPEYMVKLFSKDSELLESFVKRIADGEPTYAWMPEHSHCIDIKALTDPNSVTLDEDFKNKIYENFCSTGTARQVCAIMDIEVKEPLTRFLPTILARQDGQWEFVAQAFIETVNRRSATDEKKPEQFAEDLRGACRASVAKNNLPATKYFVNEVLDSAECENDPAVKETIRRLFLTAVTSCKSWVHYEDTDEYEAVPASAYKTGSADTVKYLLGMIESEEDKLYALRAIYFVQNGEGVPNHYVVKAILESGVSQKAVEDILVEYYKSQSSQKMNTELAYLPESLSENVFNRIEAAHRAKYGGLSFGSRRTPKEATERQL